MYITCLDVEGVLVPEIWIAFAEASGILPLAASYGCLATENPRYTARIYAISIN